ncbi:hypothetical protein ACEUZ9_000911 [Paracoccus litorisediminis]|uniref:hypothetical protein n=1 Tax=Paracoccus litorisediminis TaxID=2006130 RepID=UPI00372E6782
MKIIDEIRPREGGADVFLATADGKHMGMFRWIEAEQTLAGMCGSLGEGGLAAIRPVRVKDQGMSATNVGSFATYAFLASNRIQADDPEAEALESAAGKVAAWGDFLSQMQPGGSNPSSAAEKPRRAGLVDLTIAQIAFLHQSGLIARAGGEIAARRHSGTQIGEPISGFDAIEVQNRIAGEIVKVPKAPEFDIAATRALLAGVTRPSAHAVCWYGLAEGQSREDRIQVARAYPILAGMIADNPILAHAVDAREAIQPLLIERTNLGKGGLKRLGKLAAALPAGKLFEEGEAVRGEDQLGINRARRFSVSGGVSLELAIRHLSSLPPDRVPEDDVSWNIYHNILAGCAIPLENALGIPVAKTLSAVKSDWKSYHAALAKSADFPVESFDRRAIALTTIDAIAALEDFSRTAVLPLILSSITEHGEPVPVMEFEFFRAGLGATANLVLGESKNIAGSMFELARRYASRINALSEAIGPINDDDDAPLPVGPFSHFGPEDFQVLTGSFTASNGLVVRPLKNFAQMREESRRLKHCVGRGGYFNGVRGGTTHIYSVQSIDGSTSYATIQLSGMTLDENEEAMRRRFAIIQNYSTNNSQPSAESLRASGEWFGALKSGNLQIHRDLMRDWIALCGKHEGGKVVFSWKGACGIRWEEADRRLSAWQEWRTVIGGMVGKSDHPGVLWKSKAIRDILGEMSPATAATMERTAREAREAAALAKAAAKNSEESVEIGI